MTTIGKVNFIVDFDGRTLPLQTRKLGKELGADLAKNFRDPFDAEMAKLSKDIEAEFKRNGKIGGSAFAQSVQNELKGKSGEMGQTLSKIFGDRDVYKGFVTQSGDLEEGLRKVRVALDSARSSGVLTGDEFKRLNLTHMNWARTLRAEVLPALESVGTDADKAGGEIDRLVKRMRGSSKENDKASSSWRNLSANTRQWILIIAAVASGGQDLGGLIDAAVGGLVILGTALLDVAAGVGVFIAAWHGMTGDISKLPVAVQPAAAALQGLKKPLDDLQNTLQVGVFGGLENQITQIGTVLIPQLQGSFGTLAGYLHDTLSQVLTQAMDPANIATFNTFIANAGQVFQPLVQAAIDFFDVILKVANIAQPFAVEFAKGLDQIAVNFDKFISSAKGTKALQDFLTETADVFDHLNPLLGDAAKLILHLITPESTRLLTGFLDNLDQALPFIQTLIETLSKLDAFGLIAQIFNQVGNALVPLLNVLAPVLQFVNLLVQSALPGLSAALQIVGLVLAPLGFAFDFLNKIFSALMVAMAPFIDGINQIIAVFQAATDKVWAALQPALNSLIQAFIGLLPSPQELSNIIQTQVIPAIQQAADWVTSTLIPALESIIRWITDVIKSFGGFDGVAISVEIFTTKVAGLFQIMADAIHFNLLGIQADAANTQKKLADLTAALHASQQQAKGGASGQSGGYAVHASGGIVNGPTFITPHDLAGEAGPEAIVPLDRPLSQVSPSVRLISALLQGKAGFSGSTSSRTTNVSRGAFTIISNNPLQTGTAVLDRLVAAQGV